MIMLLVSLVSRRAVRILEGDFSADGVTCRFSMQTRVLLGLLRRLPRTRGGFEEGQYGAHIVLQVP